MVYDYIIINNCIAVTKKMRKIMNNSILERNIWDMCTSDNGECENLEEKEGNIEVRDDNSVNENDFENEDVFEFFHV